MIVMGIDPGTARMGYGFVESAGGAVWLVDYGCLTTDDSEPLPARLQHLYRSLEELITRYQPDEGAVEQLFFARNVRTALAVGQARGIVLLALANAGLGVAEYTPLQVKQAVTGYGKGDKAQIQTMVRMVLGLDHVPQPDDAADALAVAICHTQFRKMSQMIDRAKP